MTRSGRIVFLIIVMASTGSPIAFGQQAFFDEGNRLYQDGDYAGALESYRRILDEGWESGSLHFNIGNAYFKLGEIGKAILAFERARRLMPRDEDILFNLELARSLTADEIAPLPRFWPFDVVSWWVGLLPRSALMTVVAGAYWLTVVCLVLLVLRRGNAAVRWVAVLGAGLTVAFGVNLVVRESGLGQAEEAIVMAAEVGVRSAPSDDADLQVFTIHEGTKVRIDRASDAWVEIVLEDGKVGWVLADVLERI